MLQTPNVIIIMSSFSYQKRPELAKQAHDLFPNFVNTGTYCLILSTVTEFEAPQYKPMRHKTWNCPFIFIYLFLFYLTGLSISVE